MKPAQLVILGIFVAIVLLLAIKRKPHSLIEETETPPPPSATASSPAPAASSAPPPRASARPAPKLARPGTSAPAGR